MMVQVDSLFQELQMKHILLHIKLHIDLMLAYYINKWIKTKVDSLQDYQDFF